MSHSGACKNRSIARLPLHVFTNLAIEYDEDPNELRKILVSKLQGYSSEDLTTVGSFLKLTVPALVRIFNPILTYEQCNELLCRICRVCAAPGTNALSMLHRTVEIPACTTQPSSISDNFSKVRHIPSGMKSLDTGLKGGFRVGCITEVVGRTGVGKSQLAMQLCIIAAMHYNQGSIYIDTESKLSLRRLHEMVEERINRQSHHSVAYHGDHYRSTNASLPILQNIRVQSPRSMDHLLHTLSQLEQTILSINHDHHHQNNNPSKYPIRLIILDSIAAPIQREYSNSGLEPKRASVIFQIAQKLKKIAHETPLAVVVVNQVITSDSCAALGFPWFHSISSRVLLEHSYSVQQQPHQDRENNTNIGDANNNNNNIRSAKIVKSNVAGFSSMNFEISAFGLNEIS